MSTEQQEYVVLVKGDEAVHVLANNHVITESGTYLTAATKNGMQIVANIPLNMFWALEEVVLKNEMP